MTLEGATAHGMTHRWDYQLGSECGNPCHCWDCASAMVDTPNPDACYPQCVGCNAPDAVILTCPQCGAMTWHLDGRCLAHTGGLP